MPRFTLVTGAGGEMGHSMLEAFAHRGDRAVVALDLSALQPEQAAHCHTVLQGDVSDPALVQQLEQFDFEEIYHLAALLSTSAEKFPEKAHNVNVNGTMGLLMMARRIGQRTGTPVKFLFPSTIAVYGLPSIAEKAAAGRVTETQFCEPITMYGINKLYCEQMGSYVSDHMGQLTEDMSVKYVDFRGVRFPGLISAFTVPTGGTSDYAPEMIHAVAQGKPYACFVRPDTRIPFMAMPDGVRAIMELADAPATSLTRRMYNIAAFAPSAEEIAAQVMSAYPEAEISYVPHERRQAIVDSWCADANDDAARADWGWKPFYDMHAAFNDYLIPNIANVYAG